MAGEQDLINRWTLKAEDPKGLAALNLAIERAKLAPGYKFGKSAPEMELKARQADLAQRRNQYIADQNAQHTKDLASSDAVTTRLSPEVDFSQHSPYLMLEGPHRGYEHGGIAYGEDADEIPGGRRGSGGGGSSGRPKLTPAQVGKNFDAFKSAVDDISGDQMRARAAGQATYKRKAREIAEQSARMKGSGPLDAVKFNRDVQPMSMTLGDREISVPRGGHFDDEQVFGPRVGATQPAPSFEPERPIGDGDLSNDDVQGTPETDQDFREPPAFIDLRKPAGGVMAPSTRPVAHREY